jgi:mRNA interferase MazF
MTTYRKGDVLLVAFPFVNEGQSKRRPAIVVADTGDQDVLLARVTTQKSRDEFDLELGDWSSAGLLAPSVVRLHKLATINKSLIQRKLGRLSDTDRNRVASLLGTLYGGL